MKRILKSGVLLLSLAVLAGGKPPHGTTGMWAPLASMSAPRTGACAAGLPDGRVLIAGGLGFTGALDSVEFFGSSGSFSNVASMSAARSGHTCTTLQDGRVLVAGGSSSAVAEIYDPAGNRWLAAGEMAYARSGHTATLLADGQVLIVGGEGPGGVHNTLEVFDPAANSFRLVPAVLSSPRKEHAAALLPDGRVLIVGGSEGTNALASSDLYDPATDAVARGARVSTPRTGLSATTLANGTVLVAGGSDGSADLATAEIYDPSSDKFIETARLTTARRGHQAFLLPHNNQVLLIGGDPAGSSAELFTPWRRTFRFTGSLEQARSGAAGAPVGSDGLFVLAGGKSQNLVLESSRMYRFATLKTDQEQYDTGAPVTITGSGWQAGERVTLLVQEFPKMHDDRMVTVTADASGNIAIEDQQENQAPGRKYTLTALGSVSEAQVRFAASGAANLDQCANGPLGSIPGNTCDWVNGNVNGTKAHYLEGDSNAYRMKMSSLALGTNNVTIEWDTTVSGKHALDYLTDFNRTVTAANPCLGVAGCNLAAPSTFPIPLDPFVAVNMLPGKTQVPGSFTMYGGTITAVSSYSLSGAYSGNSSTRITITFIPNPNQTNVVLAWGGHIATRLDWGQLSSAAAITGSPWHMRLLDLNGTGGNQDRALSADAVIFPATITIVKQATPKSSTAFNFTASPSPLGNFTLVDDGSATNTQVFSNIITFGNYTVTEAVATGWKLDSIVCSDTDNTISVSTGSVIISLQEGENVTCTFANSQLAAHLKLVKNVDNTNGGTAVATDWTLSATGPTPLSGAGGAESDVSAGTYTLSETGGPAGYTASTWSCLGGTLSGSTLTLGPGQSATCTITNTSQKAHLKLVKTVVNANGGTAVAADWTLSAAGPTPLSGPGVAESDVNAGTYTLSETGGPAGYAASAWSCLGGTLSGSTLTLGPGQSATCTITNSSQKPHLKLVKNVDNTNGGTAVAADWTLSAAGPTPLSGAGGAESDVLAGTYTLSESGPSGYTASAWSCTGGTLSVNQLTLAPGQSATCTITNTAQRPHLKLVKAVINNNGGIAAATDWTLSAAGPTLLSGAGGAEGDVNAGAYLLSETGGPSGYTASAWSCTGGTLSGSQLTLGPGQSATCTITNDDVAPTLTVVKITVPSSDTGKFDLQINGTTYAQGVGNNGTTGPVALSIGTHTVTETAADGTGTVLTDYTTTFAGACDANGKVTLNTLGQNATCYIVNTNNICKPPILPQQ